jgi:serine phosphatase RsbU (regulator of sigma subunit)
LIRPEEILEQFNHKLLLEGDPKQQVFNIIDFCITYGDSYGDKIIPLIDRGISISKTINFEPGEIICMYNRDFYQSRTLGATGWSASTLSYPADEEALEKLKSEPVLYNMGIGLQAYRYWFSGDYSKGFNTIFTAINGNNHGDDVHTGWNLYALGIFYFDTKDFDSALKYYYLARDIFDTRGYRYGQARAATAIASVAIQKKELEKASQLLDFAAEIYRQLGHYSGLSRALNDMGLIEKERKNYDTAVDRFTESLRLREEIKHLQGMITTLTELGETYLLLDGFDTSLGFFKSALSLATEAGSKQKEMRLYNLIYKVCKQTGDTAAALDAFEKYFEARSALMGDETANQIRKLQTRFETEKAEKETEIERLRNVELKSAFSIIEEKNKDIRDSINYARRIQQAILAEEKEIKAQFPSSFLLYRPKDIVAGDFYFFESTATHVFYAAADCTGHGVPGAMMSVVCSNALTRCVKEFGLTMPGEILDKARNLVLETFRRSGAGVRDGMDISLLVKDLSNNQYYWAGANNPLWITSEEEFREIAPDKQPIGFSENSKPFTSQSLRLKKGDKIFLFTDGYADQFGGPKGKKFKYKQLIALLLGSNVLPPEALRQRLVSEFESWKGDLEQVDDICVIGVWVE